MSAATDRLAAIDLGSNSFHLVIYRLVEGEPVQLDRMREQVQLAAGLRADGSLDPAVAKRALRCLARFGERLASFPAHQVRAVGTSALRRIRDGRAFQDAAARSLGHAIEIVPGPEEARMIYLGVAHTLADDEESRLVIDIGGGSTECILGRRFEAMERHSLHMGCVDWSRRYFASGNLVPEAFERATLAARLEVRAVEHRLTGLGWHEAVGSSGTIRAAAETLVANGWSSRGVTLDGLRKLERAFCDAGTLERVELAGLKEERLSTMTGGVAILIALFEGLRLERLEVSQGAMRDGLIYDLLGRIRHEDVRERTIRTLQERGSVDRAQAERVEATALELFTQVRESWELQDRAASRFLVWAARVHEIGLVISWSQHHRHAAYLVQHSDMQGFSRDDQLLLAAILRTQRRRVRREVFRGFGKSAERLAMRLAVLLRLAVVLHRARGAEALPRFELVRRSKRVLILRFPEGWLAERFMLRADLEEEKLNLEALRIRLEFS